MASRLCYGTGPRTVLEVAQGGDEKCERTQNHHSEPEIEGVVLALSEPTRPDRGIGVAKKIVKISEAGFVPVTDEMPHDFSIGLIAWSLTRFTAKSCTKI